MKAFVLILSLFTFSITSYAAKKKVVIVQMLDGVGMEQLKRIDPDFLKQHGVTPLKPGQPSITFPALATLATGVSAAQHGVVTNKPTVDEIPFAPTQQERNHYTSHSNRLRVPPIWLFAKQMGIEVFIHQWAMSNNKWCGQPVKDNPDQVFPEETGVSIKEGIDAALKKLKTWDKKRDLLIYSYSHGLDKLGHKYGPYAKETIDEWTNSSLVLEKFISEVEQFKNQENVELSLYLLSDHGMYENYLSEAIDFKKLMEEQSIPSDVELQKLKRQRMVVVGGYELSEEQATEIGKHLRVIPEAMLKRLIPDLEATSPFFGVMVTNKEQQILLESPSSQCNYQSPNFSFKWYQCKIFEGGHHVFNRKIHQKHFDGIYFQPVGKKEGAVPRMQTEFVPMIAKKLGIDIKQQINHPFCPVEKTEETPI